MSQKKSSTPRKRRASQQTYTQQIRSLQRGIEKSENNNTLDFTRAEKVAHLKARAVLDVINIAPDFIIQAIVDAIAKAAEVTGHPRPEYSSETPTTKDIEALDSIFGACAINLYKPTTPTKTLAELIVEVIEHDDCPQEVVDGINESTSLLFNRLNEGDRYVYLTAPYIHALIVEAKLQDEAEKGGANQ